MIERTKRWLNFHRISLVLLLSCSSIIYMYLNFSPYRADLPPPSLARNGRGVPKPEDRVKSPYIFPKIIHQMWESPSKPLGNDMTRWRMGCRDVNEEWEFRFLYDNDLEAFVSKEYPQYLPLFRILEGVYMADMARILLVYHYGGIYMDADFYCHRPFDCLIHQILANELKHYKGNDMLVVSREPPMHEHLFRHKDRVVIQDFFLATPKHPFFKWLLDDRMEKLDEDKLGTRGPFSYSIERDIDRYRAYGIRSGHGNHSLDDLLDSKYFLTAGGIYELPAGVLHPLVDTTNGRLFSGCTDIKDRPAALEKICEEVSEGKFFSPRPETIAVHMWTHVYLGWSFFRSAYLSSMYNHVEQVLPPTLECPKIKKEYFSSFEGVHW